MKKPVDLETLASNVKRAFEIPAVKIFGDLDRMVSRVALCPGSGKHMTEYAIEKNCDVLITGDIDHHQGIDAIQQGIAIIDAGHHGIEHIFIDQVAGFLKERFPDLEVEKEANPVAFYCHLGGFAMGEKIEITCCGPHQDIPFWDHFGVCKQGFYGRL